MKLHITYSQTGENHSDFEAENIIKRGIDRIKGTDQELEIATTNANVVHAARVALKEKVINKDEIMFWYESQPLEHDYKGDFKDYPGQFLNITSDLLMKLI